LVEEDFIDYGLGQFQKRVGRLERARGLSLAEVTRVTNTVIDRDDA
jgi:ribonucleoside-diphosphate reductase beta chain